MKTKKGQPRFGDIVEVFDGSYGLSYRGDGSIAHTNGIELLRVRFKVLMTDLTLPTYPGYAIKDGGVNDLMLHEVDKPEHLLFTRARYCRVVERYCHNELILGTGHIVRRLRRNFPGAYAKSSSSYDAVVFFSRPIGPSTGEKPSQRYIYRRSVSESDVIKCADKPLPACCLSDKIVASWRAMAEGFDNEAPQ